MVTVTLQVAFIPFTVSAVMVAVPAFLAVTLPPDTVAMLLSDVFHVTALFVAFEGAIVAVRVILCPL